MPVPPRDVVAWADGARVCVVAGAQLERAHAGVECADAGAGGGVGALTARATPALTLECSEVVEAVEVDVDRHQHAGYHTALVLVASGRTIGLFEVRLSALCAASSDKAVATATASGKLKGVAWAPRGDQSAADARLCASAGPTVEVYRARVLDSANELVLACELRHPSGDDICTSSFSCVTFVNGSVLAAAAAHEVVIAALGPAADEHGELHVTGTRRLLLGAAAPLCSLAVMRADGAGFDTALLLATAGAPLSIGEAIGSAAGSDETSGGARDAHRSELVPAAVRPDPAGAIVELRAPAEGSASGSADEAEQSVPSFLLLRGADGDRNGAADRASSGGCTRGRLYALTIRGLWPERQNGTRESNEGTVAAHKSCEHAAHLSLSDRSVALPADIATPNVLLASTSGGVYVGSTEGMAAYAGLIAYDGNTLARREQEDAPLHAMSALRAQPRQRLRGASVACSGALWAVVSSHERTTPLSANDAAADAAAIAFSLKSKSPRGKETVSVHTLRAGEPATPAHIEGAFDAASTGADCARDPVALALGLGTFSSKRTNVSGGGGNANEHSITAGGLSELGSLSLERAGIVSGSAVAAQWKDVQGGGEGAPGGEGAAGACRSARPGGSDRAWAHLAGDARIVMGSALASQWGSKPREKSSDGLGGAGMRQVLGAITALSEALDARFDRVDAALQRQERRIRAIESKVSNDRG